MSVDELLKYLESRGPLEPGESWEGYAQFLSYWSEAQQRIPTLAVLQNFDRDAIDALLVREIEELAALVLKIFPLGGFRELENYLPTYNTKVI